MKKSLLTVIFILLALVSSACGIGDVSSSFPFYNKEHPCLFFLSFSTTKAHAESSSGSSLRELIRKDIPDIDQMSGLKKAHALREWVHATVDVAADEKMLLDKNVPGFSSRPLAEILPLFINDKGGVWCGGCASVLRRIYSEYGFEAVCLDVGIKDVMTHVVVLVRVPHGETECVIIEDPYFNITYKDESGMPLSFEDFMRALSQGGHERIETNGGRRIIKDIIASTASLENSWLAHDTTRFCAKLDERRFKFKGPVTAKMLYRVYGEHIRSALAERTEFTNPVYLYLFPFAVYGDNGPLQRQMQKWVRSFRAGTVL